MRKTTTFDTWTPGHEKPRVEKSLCGVCFWIAFYSEPTCSRAMRQYINHITTISSFRFRFTTQDSLSNAPKREHHRHHHHNHHRFESHLILPGSFHFTPFSFSHCNFQIWSSLLTDFDPFFVEIVEFFSGCKMVVQNFVVDLNKPLVFQVKCSMSCFKHAHLSHYLFLKISFNFSQVGHLGEAYDEWVHEPIISKEGPRFFQSGVLEVPI